MDPVDWSLLRTRCRGRLPHWEIPGMTAFVTFRTADALPRHIVDRYLVERRTVDRLLERDPDCEELHRERARLFGRHIDRALDGAQGACALRRPELARKVDEVLRNRDGMDYVLHASVIMPNHVHVVATLAPGIELSRATQAWKSITAHFAAKQGLPMPFWQEESYDHIVRHAGALRAVKHYVSDNPRKAGLVGWPWVYVREEEDESGKAAGEAPAPP